eukprot:g2475.t1
MQKRPRDGFPEDINNGPPPPAPGLPITLSDDRKAKSQLEDEVKPPVLEYKKDILARRLEELLEAGEDGVCVEVRISPDYMSVNHKPVKTRQLFGDLEYTHDSDLVAVLMHLGYFRMMDTAPVGMVAIKCIVRLLNGKANYESKLRNNLLSRCWNAASFAQHGCAYRVESCWLVKRDGTLLQMKNNRSGESDYLPTFIPAANDRTVATRSTTATAERRQRTLPEHTFMFNLSNEVCMKYSMFAVADRGLQPWQWTSARLHNEVMYLEDASQRFELSLSKSNYLGINTDLSNNHDLYTWARCRQLLTQERMESLGIPLPHHHMDVILSQLRWEDLKWSHMFVEIKGRRFAIMRVYFLQRV